MSWLNKGLSLHAAWINKVISRKKWHIYNWTCDWWMKVHQSSSSPEFFVGDSIVCLVPIFVQHAVQEIYGKDFDFYLFKIFANQTKLDNQ